MVDQADGNVSDKKTRHRSPNYPAVGLNDAVDRLQKLYAKNGRAGAPAEIAAVHIGFGKAHGQAMSVLSALKKFGLVSEVNGRIAPTQRGLEIVNLTAGDPRRAKALHDAVLEPPIYRELIEQHRDTGWPSDEALSSELVTYKGFNPNAAPSFVADLKASLEYSGLSSSIPLESEEAADMHTTEHREPKTLGAELVKEMERTGSIGKALSSVGDKLSGAPLLSQTLVISIPRDFKVDIGVRGDQLKKEDLTKIKSQFNRWIEGLEEAFEE